MTRAYPRVTTRAPGVPRSPAAPRVRGEQQEYAGQGRALLARTTGNEQCFTFRTHDRAWRPVDHEGLTLIRRPTASGQPHSPGNPKPGWSKAAKRRRFGRG
ncbi:type I-E CRISPR-associated endoribonuclease Cas2 [Streptomyces zingiberis]|uniref:type I-E CRISPR-associated endoribonuclease Cas2 n=1 Tax=Streptomyces zingiberis TaxID=2053010 RepID=UPI001F110B41|nr:type I-E CRISPR-associated endoribonuclease Cas2 [Streptomyces zingiberis]